MLYLHTPGGFEEYIEQLGTPAKSNEVPSRSFKDKAVGSLAKKAAYRAVKMRDVPMPNPFGTPKDLNGQVTNGNGQYVHG